MSYSEFQDILLHDSYNQWLILGRANEAVASSPPFSGAPSKIAHLVLFCCRCFLEIVMKPGRKVGNTRSIRDEDLFFFSDHHDFGRKIGKSKMKSK